MAAPEKTDLLKKLNIKDGMLIRVINKPKDVQLEQLKTTTSSHAEGILVFVKNLAEVDKFAGPAIDAAREDRLSWVLYPKAGQLGTDLNRDILWKKLETAGVQGVRLISLDAVWSAMRFRPAKK